METRIPSWGIPVFLIAAVVLPHSANSASFDISRDFSLASNPNGAWSYGWQGTIGGPFSLITVARTTLAQNGVPIESWALTQNSAPGVFHNGTTNTATSDNGAAVLPPGTVWFMSNWEGTPQNYGVIRLTVPAGASGQYRLESTVRVLADGPSSNDADYHVTRNGLELFGVDVLANSQAGYSNTLNLVAGDTVDFLCGRGPDGHVSGLKIAATLTQVGTNVPQPGLLLVVPSGLESQEGNSASGILTDQLRLQEVYAASQFPTGTLLVSQIRLRPSVDFGTGAFSISISNMQINLSTTPRQPDNLSLIFAENIGADDTVVHSGRLDVSSQFSGPGPKDFDIIVPLQRAFAYNPAVGNLLVDIRNFSGYPVRQVIDAQDGLDGASRLLAHSASATTGAADSSADVLQIVYSLTNAPPPPPPTNCVPAPANLVAWWPLNGTSQEIIGGRSLQLAGGSTFIAGKVGEALSFDGTNDEAIMPASAALNVGTASGFSIETWINPAHVTLQPIATWTPGPGGGGVHFWLGVYGAGSIFANLVDTAGGNHSWRSETDIVVPNQWQHVGMSYQKAAGLLRFYLNGVKVTEHLLGTLEPQTSYPLAIGYRPNQEHLAGSIDELSIYRRVLTDAEFAALHAAGALGKCPTNGPPPTDTNCLVAPRIATTQDEAFGAATLRAANHRNQQVYSASHFPTGVVMSIHEIRFRPDYLYGNAFTTTVQNIQINLSTTARPVEQMSSVFAQNVGADDRIVFSGTLSLSSSFSGPASGPKAFDIVVPLSAPFTYNPAQGNLLVDIRNFSGSSASLLSGRTDSTDGVSRVLGSVNSTSGLTDIGGDVLQVCFTATNTPPPPPPPGNLLVVPSGLESREGDTASGILTDYDLRLQEVYAASQFPTGTLVLSEIRLRPSVDFGTGPFSISISNIQINLSTTPRQPSNLSLIFAENIGADDTVVHSGRLDVATQFSGPAQGPKAFDIIVPLQRPFAYNPATGNLLVDIRNFSGFPARHVIDAEAGHDGASRLIAQSANATTAFIADPAADVLQIVYSQTNVPPPPPPGDTNCVVAPRIAITQDEAFGSSTLSTPNLRNQQVYDARHFPTGVVMSIHQIRFRPDYFYGRAFTTTVQNIQINLSTTTHQSEQLSAIFAQNVGADDRIVFSGALNISSTFSGPATGPKDFDIVVPLSRPFTYNPSQGNLLVDIRNFSGSSASVLSGRTDSTDGISRVLGSVNSSAGLTDIGGDVLQVCFTASNAPPPPPPPPGDTNCAVEPSIAATQDEAFGSSTLSTPNHRNQQVYNNSHFPTGVVMNIHEIRFRPDYFYGHAFATTVQNIQVNISTTLRPAEQLSAVFAQNVGADDRIVFSGALSLSSSFSGPAGGPKAFDIVLPLSTPFTYDPSRGNLLLDIRNFSGSSASRLSGRVASDDGISRVLGSLNSSSGTAHIGGDVVQICFTPTNAPPPPPGDTNCAVVPRIATTQDEAFGASTLSTANLRNQQVYDARHFPTGVVMNIHQIRFRPDYFYGRAFTATVQNIQISLSTTTNRAEQLSAVFAQNVGADDRIVFSGALSLSSSFSGPASGPKAFDIVVPLSTPFTYNPGEGNLLVDIRNFSGSSASLLSGRTDSTDGIGRVLGSVTSTSGLSDIGGDVLQVCFTATNAPPPPPPTNCVAAPAGLVAWWPGEGNANDVIGNNHGSLHNGASFAPGMVGQGFRFDGVDDFVLVPDHASLHLTNELSFELWFNATEWVPTYGHGVFNRRNDPVGCNYGLVITDIYGVQLYYNDPTVMDGDFPGNIFEISTYFPLPSAGAFHHFAGTYRQVDATHIELKTYIDGALVRTRTLLGNLRNTLNGGGLTIGAAEQNGTAVFKGVIDEVSLYNRALSASEIGSIYEARSAGKCTNAPSIDQLIALVNDAPPSVNKDPLLSILDSAKASLAQGNILAAINQLSAFQNQVQAQVTPVDTAFAAQLITMAQQIIESLDPSGARRSALAAMEGQPVRVLRMLPIEGAGLCLEGCAMPGVGCAVQRSTNLRDWVDIGTPVEISDGVYRFVDPNPKESVRFYRLKTP